MILPQDCLTFLIIYLLSFDRSLQYFSAACASYLSFIRANLTSAPSSISPSQDKLILHTASTVYDSTTIAIQYGAEGMGRVGSGSSWVAFVYARRDS
ncbi:hypothetical protein C8R45DRAFT_1025517 [Mycena sanguinolenta]|nr:hypothetical protein C8R45DRAFT_1025517 [Mycena sanguinolenta]